MRLAYVDTRVVNHFVVPFYPEWKPVRPLDEHQIYHALFRNGCTKPVKKDGCDCGIAAGVDQRLASYPDGSAQAGGVLGVFPFEKAFRARKRRGGGGGCLKPSTLTAFAPTSSAAVGVSHTSTWYSSTCFCVGGVSWKGVREKSAPQIVPLPPFDVYP